MHASLSIWIQETGEGSQQMTEHQDQIEEKVESLLVTCPKIELMNQQ